ncbi:MAG TPA: outer membrane beta-barrel protein [Longimicrobiales bacterium]|nr:outer membrane beta-barrel protein [Longimicrobiales bacterium]
MRVALLPAAMLLALPRPGTAQYPDTTAADTTAHITWGAYADAYYAYDFNIPPRHDRVFTTQAARWNEFNANLTFLEANYKAPRVRARAALQAGTAVQFNYGAEPDTLAGLPNYLPLIQELYAGVAPAENLWIDAGIFFSHIGSEGWISADNPTYTRSLPADFSPYYETGVRATWQATKKVTATAVFVNGWQIILENNQGKAGGLRLDYAVSPAVTLSYSNYLGNDLDSTTGVSRTRFFNDFIARVTPDDRTLVIGTFDVGGQSGDRWYGGSLIAREKIGDRIAVSARYDGFHDPDGVVAAGIPRGDTIPGGLQTSGGSLGLDWTMRPGVLWRFEFRGFFGADEPTFPKHTDGEFTDHDTALITALTFRF